MERIYSPDRKPQVTRYTKLLILDLDGVVIRWPGHHRINYDALARLGSSLDMFYDTGGRISVVTNRPPAEMQPISYFLKSRDTVWVTESGGSLYDPSTNTQEITPKYTPYASTYVPEIREILRDELKIPTLPDLSKAQFLAGMGYVKTVIIPPSTRSVIDYVEEVHVALDQYPDRDRFRVETGKAIDIDPYRLSKSEGMQLVLEKNGVDPKFTPTLFVADHKRDISAASELLLRGGMIAAVGNADEEYRKFVRKNNGYLADDNYHGSLAQIVERFINE